MLLGKSELCYMCCTEYGASPVCFVGFFGTIFEDLCGATLQYLINCRDSQGNRADEKDEEKQRKVTKAPKLIIRITERNCFCPRHSLHCSHQMQDMEAKAVSH